MSILLKFHNLNSYDHDGSFEKVPYLKLNYTSHI